MRNEKDKSTIYLLNLDPIVVDTHLKFIKLKWNHNGSILAVSGTQKVTFNTGEEKDICALFLYDSFGNVIIYSFIFRQILKTLKIPGNTIESLSWEHMGVRISLAVDSFIYFAHLRQDYHWSFFASEVLAVAHTKGEDCDWYITFCNTRLKEQVTRYHIIISNQRSVSRLLLMSSFEENCVVITKAEDLSEQ